MQLNRVHNHLIPAIVALFMATQIMCAFHTHDLDEIQHGNAEQEIECDLCSIANLPYDVDTRYGFEPPLEITQLTSARPPEVLKKPSSYALINARAPPLTATYS